MKIIHKLSYIKRLSIITKSLKTIFIFHRNHISNFINTYTKLKLCWGSFFKCNFVSLLSTFIIKTIQHIINPAQRTLNRKLKMYSIVYYYASYIQVMSPICIMLYSASISGYESERTRTLSDTQHLWYF